MDICFSLLLLLCFSIPLMMLRNVATRYRSLSGILWMHFWTNMMEVIQWYSGWRELSSPFHSCDSRLSMSPVHTSTHISSQQIRKQRDFLYFSFSTFLRKGSSHSYSTVQYPFCLFSSLRKEACWKLCQFQVCEQRDAHLYVAGMCLSEGNGGSGRLDWNHWAEE